MPTGVRTQPDKEMRRRSLNVLSLVDTNRAHVEKMVMLPGGRKQTILTASDYKVADDLRVGTLCPSPSPMANAENGQWTNRGCVAIAINRLFVFMAEPPTEGNSGERSIGSRGLGYAVQFIYASCGDKIRKRYLPCSR